MNPTSNTHALPPIVSVIGNASIKPGSVEEKLAFATGRILVDRGFRLMTGGMGGVMEAAHKGARSSASWRPGTGIGMLPGRDISQANPFVDIAIPTGLDHGRNQIVSQADAVIAIGGGAGTLTELGFAWIYKRLIVALRCSGWSSRLADTRIDDRTRYPKISDDRVYGADTAEEAVGIIESNLSRYNLRHDLIRPSREHIETTS